MKIYQSFKKRNRAFTLIEILAALVLFSILALGISSTLSQTTKLTFRLKEREATTFTAQIAMDRLQRDLQNAFNENRQGSKSIFKAEEVAAGPSLTFSFFESPMKVLTQRRTSGFSAVHYRLESEPSGTYALYRVQGPVDEADRLKDRKGQLVASGILKWTLELYDQRNDQWIKTWDTSGRSTGGYFPKAAKIFIQATDPSLSKEQREKKSLSLATTFYLLNELESP